MNCLSPIIRKKHRYKSFNGKIVPIETFYYICPCGKCIPCLLDDQRDWAFRLQLEAEVRETAWFITLTFADEFLPSDRCVHKEHLQSFLNHLRKKLERICKKYHCNEPKLTYFAVGEYGRESNRPHYHLMLFGFPIHKPFEMLRIVEDVWRKGFCKVEWCDSSTCNYICKYMTKLDPRPHEIDSFRLMSRRPALGFIYFDLKPHVVEYINRPDVNSMRFKDGRNHRIPRSIRRKYYSPFKQQLNNDTFKCSKEWMDVHQSEVVEYCRRGRERNKMMVERLNRKFK